MTLVTVQGVTSEVEDVINDLCRDVETLKRGFEDIDDWGSVKEVMGRVEELETKMDKVIDRLNEIIASLNDLGGPEL